ncbi:MAG: CpXC domain-containing protein [Eubacterium sp.]|nr:CpXC domain-containing protein [Eubacterium sp.]
MAKEIFDVECPGCGESFRMDPMEFCDVTDDPDLKARIIEGDFFMNICPEYGAMVVVEYPIMYIDRNRDLKVYLAPEHEDDLLQQMNSLSIKDQDETEQTEMRLVSTGVELMEKILIREAGLDDRLIELYKFLIWDQISEAWPGLAEGDLLFMFDEEGEYLVVWPSDNGNDEKLTAPLDREFYQELADQYLEFLDVPTGKYAEVNQAWIGERFER